VRHVTIAPHLTQLLRERFGREADEVVYVVDHETFHPHLPRVRDAAAPLRVGLVGPYEVPWKDIKTGLEACKLAARAGQPIQLVRVTNTAPHRDEQDLPFDVEWHTRVRPADMGAIYRSMDVFLGTSSGAEEGFFLPAVEAMASGVPCVLTDIPCFRSHGDGEYALFVPARDPAAMAEALIVAARVPDVAAALRENGIAAAQRYTQDAHGTAIEAALLRAAQSVGRCAATTTELDAASQRLVHELELAAANASMHGDEAAASRFLSAALCLNGDDAELHNRIGVWLYGLGDAEFARACFQRALRLDPTNADATDNLIQIGNA